MIFQLPSKFMIYSDLLNFTYTPLLWPTRLLIFRFFIQNLITYIDVKKIYPKLFI